MFFKKWHVRPDRHRERQRNWHTISNGPHWGSLDPNMGINILRRWNPTLKLIKIQKSQKSHRLSDGRADILYCHSGDFTPCPAIVCAARNYGPRALISKKRRGRPDIEIDIEKDTQTHKLDWTPLGSLGTQCAYKCIATLEPHTGNSKSNSSHI